MKPPSQELDAAEQTLRQARACLPAVLEAPAQGVTVIDRARAAMTQAVHAMLASNVFEGDPERASEYVVLRTGPRPGHAGEWIIFQYELKSTNNIVTYALTKRVTVESLKETTQTIERFIGLSREALRAAQPPELSPSRQAVDDWLHNVPRAAPGGPTTDDIMNELRGEG